MLHDGLVAVVPLEMSAGMRMTSPVRALSRMRAFMISTSMDDMVLLSIPMAFAAAVAGPVTTAFNMLPGHKLEEAGEASLSSVELK